MSELTSHPQHEEALLMKSRAEADEDYHLRCIASPHKVFFLEADQALAEGHIYSDAGLNEYRISKFCEWCFDKTADEAEAMYADDDPSLEDEAPF